MSKIIEIYTDGACKGNPGVGGWGAWLKYNEQEKSLFGGEENTTNNRMEMTAVIRALEALKRPSLVKLYTDSVYVQKGIMSPSKIDLLNTGLSSTAGSNLSPCAIIRVLTDSTVLLYSCSDISSLSTVATGTLPPALLKYWSIPNSANGIVIAAKIIFANHPFEWLRISSNIN